MRFLTEDDIRARSPKSGGLLTLGKDERLTPSAAEYIAGLHLRVESEKDPSGKKAGSVVTEMRESGQAAQDKTHLDKDTLVSKTHPSIIMRGKLDTLLAEIVLTQARFDPCGKRPVFLKQCLEDLRRWVWETLSAEVTGDALSCLSMGGMNVDVLRQVSRDPEKYLGLSHITVDASLGVDVAELNRLRALVRETEVMAVACSGHPEVIHSLNRLSSAVYVLMLLILGAERGLAVKMPAPSCEGCAKV